MRSNSRSWVVGGLAAVVAVGALGAGIGAGAVVDGVAAPSGSAVTSSQIRTPTAPVAVSPSTPGDPDVSSSVAPDGSQVVRIGDPALYADEISPTTAGAGPGGLVWRQVFRTLTRSDSGSLELRPDLATSWSVAAGGRSWIFHLATGNTFHDGSPVDATAVCANIDSWAQQEDHLGWDFYLSESDYQGCDPVADTVTVRFGEGISNLPHLFSEVSFSIAAPDSIGTGYRVGSGPYRWAGSEGDTVRLEAVDPADGGPDVIELVEEPSMSSAISELRAGRLDAVVGAGGDEIGSGTDVRRIETAQDTMTTVNLLAGSARLGDLQVRRALIMALDRGALADLMGTRPGSTLAPAVLGLGTYDQPAGKARAARELLQGKKVEPLVIGVGDTGEGDVEQARLIRSQFAAVGVSASISVEPDPDEFYDQIRAGRYDVTVETFYADNLDPAEYVYWFDPRGAYRLLLRAADRPELEELGGWVFTSQDPRSRRASATAFLQELVDASVMMPIAGQPAADWVGARVRSWPTGPFGIVDLSQVRLR